MAATRDVRYILVEAPDDEKAPAQQTNRPPLLEVGPEEASRTRAAKSLAGVDESKQVMATGANLRRTVFPDLVKIRQGRASLTLEEAKQHRAVLSRRQFKTKGVKGQKSNESSAGMVLTTRLVAEEGCQSSAGGTFYNAFNVYTDATSGVLNLGEFADFSALFRQYRIRKIRFTFVPFSPNKTESSINTQGRALTVALDPDNDATPSSILQVFANSNAGMFHSQVTPKFVKTWHNTDERWFDSLDAANPLVPEMSIKVAGDANLGNTIVFGVIFFEYWVEFRARL